MYPISRMAREGVVFCRSSSLPIPVSVRLRASVPFLLHRRNCIRGNCSHYHERNGTERRRRRKFSTHSANRRSHHRRRSFFPYSKRICETLWERLRERILSCPAFSHTTCSISYSDSAEEPKKCHCMRLSLYPMIFSIIRYFLDPKAVTVAGLPL